MRVAIVGTFDLANYGDLLFPLLARHELERRVDDLELLPFSYHAKDASAWPYAVHSVADLPQALPDLDGLIVGGGHLIRFDTAVADGYGPPPGVDHPTGLWLIPALLAAAAGKPVVWNAVGASPDFGAWGAPLLRAALEASALVTVRDTSSQATLRAISSTTDVGIVPDTAFGLAPLLQAPELVDSFAAWRRDLGLEGPYVVVQGCTQLLAVAERLEAQLRDLAERGYTIVELPIGPILDDHVGLIAPDWEDVVRVEEWPDPLRLAQIVAHAEAAVGYSLHLGITALCHGVPLHRPRCWPGLKYEILARFPGVHQFDDHGRRPRIDIAQGVGRGPVAPQVEECVRSLAEHWDRAAQALTERRPVPPPALARLLSELPETLRQAARLSGEEDAPNASAELVGLRSTLADERLGAKALRAEVARKRATVAELHRSLTELRRLTGAERQRLEEELQAARSRSVAMAERHQAATQLLEEIGKSRAFRLSNRLQQAYGTLFRHPWQAMRRLFVDD
jgi:lipopolysaccharide transport system ATP-binding protein